jgi:hypothetical protein
LYICSELERQHFKEVDSIIESKMVRFAEVGGYGCSDCTFTSNVKYTMVNHIESRHVSYGGVACPLCGKVSANRQALRMHKSREHKKVSLKQC